MSKTGRQIRSLTYLAVTPSWLAQHSTQGMTYSPLLRPLSASLPLPRAAECNCRP